MSNGTNEKNINKMPLVSVLIPTYNRPHYFEKALCSVLEQTYPNVEIIIGMIVRMMKQKRLQKYLCKHSNIIYIKIDQTFGQFENALMLLNKANGEYINFLMDDDLFHVNKIQK